MQVVSKSDILADSCECYHYYYHEWIHESFHTWYTCDISVTWSFSKADFLLLTNDEDIHSVFKLIILHKIMRQVQFDRKLSDLSQSCNYFHLIKDTSTDKWAL